LECVSSAIPSGKDTSLQVEIRKAGQDSSRCFKDNGLIINISKKILINDKILN